MTGKIVLKQWLTQGSFQGLRLWSRSPWHQMSQEDFFFFLFIRVQNSPAGESP
jgi:hypothetical protein